ncbi:hypothetical protein IWX90DRAFT_145834 [Phyllosticta citrichinensis]|uniref:Secreted protein n=1 Tax=Phyllosticta citrichinensis TaxID=1130410 RepID=A0ABR1XZ26_9PEZI
MRNGRYESTDVLRNFAAAVWVAASCSANGCRDNYFGRPVWTSAGACLAASPVSEPRHSPTPNSQHHLAPRSTCCLLFFQSSGAGFAEDALAFAVLAICENKFNPVLTSAKSCGSVSCMAYMQLHIGQWMSRRLLHLRTEQSESVHCFRPRTSRRRAALYR